MSLDGARRRTTTGMYTSAMSAGRRNYVCCIAAQVIRAFHRPRRWCASAGRARLGDRQLGTTFQFGEYLGVGVAFGERRQFAEALRLLHESNCGINRSDGHGGPASM